MPTRNATTVWQGPIDTGEGQVDLTSSGLGTFDVSIPRRTSEQANGSTSPEELLAAAHSACYAMQLAAVLSRQGAIPHELNVAAAVTLGPDRDGGFKLTGISLSVRGSASGIEHGAFIAAAEAAKVGCPLSKALAGVTVTLDVADMG